MPQNDKVIFAIDFDGTIADNRYPEIGDPVPGAVETIKMLQRAGCHWILFTMRSGAFLERANAWCLSRGLYPWALNCNPEQHKWTNSRKVYAHYYIDDTAVGCPLRENPQRGGAPMVDWEGIRDLLPASVLIEKDSQ
jgi:hypothetical protein